MINWSAQAGQWQNSKSSLACHYYITTCTFKPWLHVLKHRLLPLSISNCFAREIDSELISQMSLRVRTPTNASVISNVENDEPPPSTSKGKSFFQERGWTTLTIMRGVGVLLVSTMVLSVSHGSFVASGGGPVTHENIRRRQATDGGDAQCTIWMAPSSLKGLDDAYGIFTTRDIQKGSSIFNEPNGPSIPIIDYNKGEWLTLWYEYVWARGVADQVTFLGNKVMDFQVSEFASCYAYLVFAYTY